MTVRDLESTGCHSRFSVGAPRGETQWAAPGFALPLVQAAVLECLWVRVRVRQCPGANTTSEGAETKCIYFLSLEAARLSCGRFIVEFWWSTAWLADGCLLALSALGPPWCVLGERGCLLVRTQIPSRGPTLRTSSNRDHLTEAVSKYHHTGG